MKVLIVRLGSLGDIIHALPVAQALRDAFPDGRIDWMVDARQREILELVPAIDEQVAVERSFTSWVGATALARRTRYDVALDLQGLLKSALLARATGARRVIGFSKAHLREPAAAAFYTDRIDPGGATHVIEKNLSTLSALDVPVPDRPFRFPLRNIASTVLPDVRRQLKLTPGDPFAIVNCGAGWPNKRWPAERFGAVAAALKSAHGWPSVVLWGPGERALAEVAAAHADGAAVVSPETTVGDVIAIAREARLIVSGDTGPLHIATAVGTPAVGIFGPTSPARNGPWSSDDRTLSRFETCVCHHERRCRRERACVLDITVDEVVFAVNARVGGLSRAR